MEIISQRSFAGERPLFSANNLRLEGVKFLPGESALKQCHHVEAIRCEFIGKYPFWHGDDVVIEHGLFTASSRAAIWYTQNIRMVNCVVEAPKMFREVSHLYLEKTRLLDAAECCWNCHDVEFRNVEIGNGDYLFMNATDIRIDGLKLQGNYSFQGTKNVVIRNARLDSKDAFWNAENVTVYDSVLDGEYLGWHSTNLRLVNCTIRGTQPLCYAQDLLIENCVMVDADLCFEYSTLRAEIDSDILSVKNPSGGFIRAKSIGELILDENCAAPGACEIRVDEALAV